MAVATRTRQLEERAKAAVLVCVELAGPPPAGQTEAPSARRFAATTAWVSADERLLALVAAAVEDRDALAWLDLVEEQGLEEFSQLLCLWACTVDQRLVGDTAGAPTEPAPLAAEPAPLAAELRAAGRAVGEVAAAEDVFAAAVAAAEANRLEPDVERALDAAGQAAGSFFVVEWLSSWRRLCLAVRFSRLARPGKPCRRPAGPAPAPAPAPAPEAVDLWSPEPWFPTGGRAGSGPRAMVSAGRA